MECQSPVIQKEKIVEKYIPLVKYLASRIMLGKTKYIEYEDLVSYGIVGLLDAINRYDSSKGMKFSSYATLRIKGAMIDEIRKNRPISKGAMDKLAKYNESVERLQNIFMREPSIKEIAIDLEYNEKLEILSEAIEKLKEKDKLILNLYYYEKFTLKEIGQVLEVSESRVCQLHSRAIRNLREIMKKKNYI